MKAAFCILILGLACEGAFGDDKSEPTEFKIGGPRKVIASVESVDKSIVVIVEMLGVRSFDSAKNRQINRAKAEAYGKIAVAKYLKAEFDAHSTSTVVLRGNQVVEVNDAGKRFRLTMKVPTDGVSVQKTVATIMTKAKTPSSASPTARRDDSNVLTVKDDYLTTLDALAHTLREDAPPIPPKSSKANAFFEAIASSEEAGMTAFLSMRAEVRDEKLLLSIEKEELFSKIEIAEHAFVELLQEQVAQFERTQRQEKNR